jgi:secernin
VVLPQVRQTHAVLACRSAGRWGYWHGVNEHHVAAGVTAIRTRLACAGPVLTGTDLVRLALERAASARQAVDVLTDLVNRHGQGTFPGDASYAADPQAGDEFYDSSFLVADGQEAYVLETSGCHWALQVVGAVRAVTDLCQLRQDWDRISRGLADVAIERGWWPDDGSKLDFAGAVGRAGTAAGARAASLRRWGRATLLLEQHNGQIHLPFLRHVLSGHDEGLPAAGPAGTPCTGASLVAVLGPGPEQPPVAWCSFGAPCPGLYFPLFLEADLPPAFEAETPTSGSRLWRQMVRLGAAPTLRPALADLQEQLDEHAREFLAEAALLRQRGDVSEVRRLAGSLMQHNLESWEHLCEEAGLGEERSEHDPGDPELHYAAAPARALTRPLTLSDEDWFEP